MRSRGTALCRRPVEPEQKTIVEEGGMIDAVGVADQRIGEAAQFDEAMPRSPSARAKASARSE